MPARSPSRGSSPALVLVILAVRRPPLSEIGTEEQPAANTGDSIDTRRSLRVANLRVSAVVASRMVLWGRLGNRAALQGYCFLRQQPAVDRCTGIQVDCVLGNYDPLEVRGRSKGRIDNAVTDHLPEYVLG